MNDLELDNESHDLVIENGDLNLLNNEAKVARQTLTINLLFFRGEWFLDLEYGVPYFQSILTKGVSKNVVDSILRAKILESYRIDNITTFKSAVRDEGYYIDLLVATTQDGEIISVTNQLITEVN